jgi:hypothetical protein
MSILKAHVSTGHSLSEGARHSCPEAAARNCLDNMIAHGAGWSATHATVSAGTPSLFNVRRARDACFRPLTRAAALRTAAVAAMPAIMRIARASVFGDRLRRLVLTIADGRCHLAAAQVPMCKFMDNGEGMTADKIHYGLLGRGESVTPKDVPAWASRKIISHFATGHNVATAHLAKDGEVIIATVKRGGRVGVLCRHVRALGAAIPCAAPSSKPLTHRLVFATCCPMR